MKHFYFFISLFLISWVNVINAKNTSDPLTVNEFKLSNGLSVWVNVDKTQPKVVGAVVINAGAKNSPNTGIAHYFEHIMFKGTDKIGTIDYATEKMYQDSIEVKYDELANTKDDEQRKVIQAEINRLTIKSANYIIPNEFDRLITRYGGSDLNAFTSYDITVYHNSFSPQYIAQWAEINSERLLHPVFRLFQSELETVYEEKNMYSDQLGALAVEKLLQRFFSPHPYEYPIIGSTENLKNPRLSEMDKFFNDYYVAGNMCLVLSGDIDTQNLLPILEKTFGRVRPGTAPLFSANQPTSFNGIEDFTLKFPIPIIKGRIVAWRGVPNYDSEALALKVVAGLLNNSNGTGYLDKLMTDNKVMGTGVMNDGFNDAGFIGALIIPKIPFQSLNKAQKMVMDQIDRIKKGDFTDEQLTDIKLDLKRSFETSLEDIHQRAQVMFTLYSMGKSWNEYMKNIENLDKLSREDIISIANKYLTSNYLQVTKKTGNYPKETLQKPGFAPIIPKNTELESDYAKSLEKSPVPSAQLRFLDFNEDVKTTSLTKNVTLYHSKNPMNSVFTLSFDFGKGSLESKYAELVSSYMNLLGTDSLSFDELRGKLQHLGSTINFTSGNNNFSVNVTGYDKSLEETLKLVGHFLTNAKGDQKKMKQVIDVEKLNEQTLTKTPQNLASILTEKVIYGDNSKYLNRLSLKEVKKLKADKLIEEFKQLTSVSCDIHYCGTLNDQEVANAINKNISLAKINVPSNAPYYRPIQSVGRNIIYFINEPKATQTVLYSYTPGEVNADDKSRSTSALFNNYFGSGMASILFQEVREFRSLAYGVGARYRLSPNKHREEKGYLYAVLTTQADKTMDAISLLDSLTQNMPLRNERIASVRQDVINTANNDFPPFREVSKQIAELKRNGYEIDPNIQLVNMVKTQEIDDINTFYQNNVKGKPTAYIVVGNAKLIDMNKLASYGEITNVKMKDIIK